MYIIFHFLFFPIFVDSDIPVCSSFASFDLKPGTHCVPEENVKDTLQLIKRLHPILVKKAISAQCDNTKEPPYLNNNDIIKMFANNEKVGINNFLVNTN